jgi:hypothetical protein
MITITNVPGALFAEDHLSCKYRQADWM